MGLAGCSFSLSIFFYLYMTTGIKRTNGLIRMKFGVGIWGGFGMVITKLQFEFLYFDSIYLSFSVCA